MTPARFDEWVCVLVAPVFVGVLLWLLLFGCSTPDPSPSVDASPYDRVPRVDAAPDAPTEPDARAPVHDVTPVCADDAAGCNPEPPHACPPWCPAGGPIGHRQQ